jgi:hypothetical protein
MLVRRDPEHVARIPETVDLVEDDGVVGGQVGHEGLTIGELSPHRRQVTVEERGGIHHPRQRRLSHPAHPREPDRGPPRPALSSPCIIPRLSARFLSHRVSTTAISASTLMTELWIRL